MATPCPLPRRIGLAAGTLLALLPAASQARLITMPWVIDLALDSGTGPSQIDPFDASHTVSGTISARTPIFDVAGISVTAGLTFGSEFTSDYRLRLPFAITLETPDSARPGQTVTVRPQVALAGAPLLQAAGSASYDTSLFVRGRAYAPIVGEGTFDTGDIALPDRIPVSQGSGVRLGGEGSYAASDTSAEAIQSRPFALTYPDAPLITGSLGGQSIGVDKLAPVPGYQLSTRGEIAAWAADVNLLDIAKQIPVIGAAAAAADIFVDLDLRAQMALVENTTINTGLMYGFYTVPGFDSFGAVNLNTPDALDGFEVRIPNSAAGQFEMEFYALGLGFSMLQAYEYIPQLKLILDAIDPLGSWQIAGGNVGAPWDIGRQYTRFSYLDAINGFGSSTIDQGSRTLVWDILANAPDVVLPPLPTTPLPDGGTSGTEDGVSGAGDSFVLPGTAPTGEVIPIPAPAQAGFTALAALFATLALRRRPACAGRSAAL